MWVKNWLYNLLFTNIKSIFTKISVLLVIYRLEMILLQLVSNRCSGMDRIKSLQTTHMKRKEERDRDRDRERQTDRKRGGMKRSGGKYRELEQSQRVRKPTENHLERNRNWKRKETKWRKNAADLSIENCNERRNNHGKTWEIKR